MSERKILRAALGMMLTNGEIYGKVIYLAVGADESEFYEIAAQKCEMADTEACAVGGNDAGP